MIIDPTAVLKASSSVAPIPTIVPGNDSIYVKAGDVGNRTLWYCPSGTYTLLQLMSSGLSLSSWRFLL
jgi:hypothetical protein